MIVVYGYIMFFLWGGMNYYVAVGWVVHTWSSSMCHLYGRFNWVGAGFFFLIIKMCVLWLDIEWVFFFLEQIIKPSMNNLPFLCVQDFDVIIFVVPLVLLDKLVPSLFTLMNWMIKKIPLPPRHLIIINQALWVPP